MKVKFNIQALIKGCRAKDPKAQRALVDLYSRRLYAICIRYVGDRHKAKDVLQDVLIKVFEKFDMYDSDKGELFSWLSKITIRTCLNELKKRKTNHIELETIAGEVFSQDLSAIELMSKEEVLKKIAELPDGYREVFNLFVIEGYSHKEIGEMFDYQEVTSRSKFYRARKLLMGNISNSKSRQYG